jgi:hypothetical protein
MVRTKSRAVALSSPRVLLSQHCSGLPPIALPKICISKKTMNRAVQDDLRFCNSNTFSFTTGDSLNKVIADLICMSARVDKDR